MALSLACMRGEAGRRPAVGTIGVTVLTADGSRRGVLGRSSLRGAMGSRSDSAACRRCAAAVDVASGGVACDSAPMQRRWHLRLAVLCFADGPCGVVL